MAADGRTYIRVHDGMPDHPKIDALSDKAFRLLIETWCWCSRHLTDGQVPRATWNRRGTPKVRRELVEAGLVEDHGSDGVVMHDYLEHQRSRAQVEDINDARREASIKGNHRRWHVGKGRTDPNCPLCDPISDTPGIGKAIPEGVPKESQNVAIGRGIGIGREEGVKLGGDVPDPNASDSTAPAPIFDPENPRCARHAHIAPGQPVPSCRECADVRRQARQMTTEQQAADQAERAARRAAIDACPDCDERGMRDFGELGVGRCTHPNLTEVPA